MQFDPLREVPMNSFDQEKFDEVFGEGADAHHIMQALLAAMPGLAGTGGTPITAEDVQFHDGKQIVLPNGMTYERAFEILVRLYHESETRTTFNYSFNYRPDDGANAVADVLQARYGVVFGEVTETQRGDIPPETRTIQVAFGKSRTVPWGHISIPSLPGLELVLCGSHPHSEYGLIFEIHALGPKKYKAELDALHDAIDEHLKLHSIYRGKIVKGANALEFVDLSGFDPLQIVFSDLVTAQLEGVVWAPMRYPKAFRSEGISGKRTALMYGPYGTGKSSIGLITAQIAEANGWTCILAKPGEDSVEDVLRIAKLYGPCAIVIEDIEVAANVETEVGVSALLEAFDGITAKGSQLVVVMTTNHVAKIHKGMIRPGRLDVVTNVAELDDAGVERLIRRVVPDGKLAADVDFAPILEAMKGFLPAFVREGVDRAKSMAIHRLKGAVNYVLSTADLVTAAESLHDQLRLYNEAESERQTTELNEALRKLARDAALEALNSATVSGDGLTMTVTAGDRNGKRGH
jgi:transitional endoplasmic reticulum ATPase